MRISDWSSDVCSSDLGDVLRSAAQRPAAMGGALRRSRRLGLAARPDQVVRAILAFDQAGIDRSRKRRIVEGHGLVFPPGLAGLVPRRADVVAGGLAADVRGVGRQSGGAGKEVSG